MKEKLTISKETKKNWVRLNVDESEIKTKLSKRANKLYSTKNIVPVEYFRNKNNITPVNDLISYISEKKLDIETIIYNLGLNLLKKSGMVEIIDGRVVSQNKHLLNILNEFKSNLIIPELLSVSCPDDEGDILGIIYQSLQKEGQKNKQGSYYTPQNIIEKITSDISPDSVYLDPCCGTGGFLLAFGDIITNPENLWGFDKDKIACFIAKINLILKFRDKNFEPKIFNRDFLLLKNSKKGTQKFDMIATNPPWGAFLNEDYSDKIPEVTSGEIFSYFIIQSEKFLNKDGKCSFVLPISIMNVSTHSDIRKFILDKFQINKIELLGKPFSGVFSDVILLNLAKQPQKNLIKIVNKKDETQISIDVYKKNPKYNFTILNNQDNEILDKIYSIPYNTLKESVWGLGIVTGNNTKHITKRKRKNSEKIYTGKKIKPYFINDTDEYIEYKRENFQQCAPDYIYRAPEKLVYKFISKTPVFAYDDKKRLFINSANILIPKVQTHTVKTALAFLNSTVFKFIYTKKFGELKMLKANLSELPFPILSDEDRYLLDDYVKRYLSGGQNLDLIDEMIFRIFSLDRAEIDYINQLF